VLQAADAAEVRGDAVAALEVIGAHPVALHGGVFWHPERVRRLNQLITLPALLPRWATSRWILAQAVQCLDSANRSRGVKAMQAAVHTRGGPSMLRGVDAIDAKAKVMDHDWVYRQSFLYELGGLDHFVRRVASSDLLAGADRIDEWARTPMGAYRFLTESRRALTWEDLGTGEPVETLNLGARSLLLPGDCAVGRAVPIEEGLMFESTPLFVPEPAAARVAEDPAGWIDAVAAACREVSDPDDACRPGGHGFELLTDVPRLVQGLIQRVVVDRQDAAALVIAAIRGGIDEDALEISPWPSVSAALLEPHALDRVIEALTPRDRSALVKLADDLPGPAADVCRWIANDLRESA
jgi:hypothetical protein